MIIHFHGKVHLEPKYEKRNPNIQRIFHFVDRTRSRKREREQKFETREREKRIESTPSSTKFGFHSDGESPIEDLTGRMSRFAFPKAFNSSKAGHSGQIE